MNQQFDILVIGAGPGGYIAAIRAAQLGFKVACAESNSYADPKENPRLGGTCLNVGCIPSKSLLETTKKYYDIIHHSSDHGISIQNSSIDIHKMMRRKSDIIQKMTNGIQFLFRKNNISILKGHASFIKRKDNSYYMNIKGKNSTTETVIVKNVIIATGSTIRSLSNINIDNKIICDSEGALSFESIPKRLGIIGAGAIGLELGSVWGRLGSNVTLLEASSTFLSMADETVSQEAYKYLSQQDLKIKLGIQIQKIECNENIAIVTYMDSNKQKILECDRLIICIGRKPNTEGLGFENIGIQLDEAGFIPVNNQTCETKIPGVYAIGDVIRGPMLAHKAEDEGILVAEILSGQKPHINYNCIPWVIYTSPEIAWVGQTEEQIKNTRKAYKSGLFPFIANGRALSAGKTDGFVKVLSDSQTDEILGVHIVCDTASELITEATMALEFQATAEDIGYICHPHPSFAEAMREASLAVSKGALNI